MREERIYPCFLFEIPSVIRSEEFHVDVAMVQVCPPDRFGNVSLGVTGDYTVAAVEQADIVIAQVNKYVPRTFGDVYMPVENFDYFVEMDQPLINLPQEKFPTWKLKSENTVEASLKTELYSLASAHCPTLC